MPYFERQFRLDAVVNWLQSVRPGVKEHHSCRFDEQRPIGGDAVINSIGVSICGDFFAVDAGSRMVFVSLGS